MGALPYRLRSPDQQAEAMRRALKAGRSWRQVGLALFASSLDDTTVSEQTVVFSVPEFDRDLTINFEIVVTDPPDLPWKNCDPRAKTLASRGPFARSIRPRHPEIVG